MSGLTNVDVLRDEKGRLFRQRTAEAVMKGVVTACDAKSKMFNSQKILRGNQKV